MGPPCSSNSSSGGSNSSSKERKRHPSSSLSFPLFLSSVHVMATVALACASIPSKAMAFVTPHGCRALLRSYAPVNANAIGGPLLRRHARTGIGTDLRSSASRPLSAGGDAAPSDASGARPRRPPPTYDTGGLRRFPVFRPAKEIIGTARRRAYNDIRPDASVKNIRNRARKHGAQKMDAVVKGLCIPLRDVVDGYRRVYRRLHPFEKVVADLTVRARQKRDGLTLDQVLDEIHEGRKELLLFGKDWGARCKAAPTAREAAAFLEEGEDAMYNLFTELVKGPVDGLLQLQKELRSVPAVVLDSPAVVLVGSPNVGKSSIVRVISSAAPEVNNYPFTTRGMTLGHVDVPLKGGAYLEKCQVMDSPGLLARPDDERNEMEALTLAAMMHLPTAVMYVMDLSGGAGDRCSSIKDQLELRKEVRARFPRRPWIDVVSKVDLGVVDGVEEELANIIKDSSDNPYIRLSIHDNIGVEELQVTVLEKLGQVRVVLDAMKAKSSSETSSE